MGQSVRMPCGEVLGPFADIYERFDFQEAHKCTCRRCSEAYGLKAAQEQQAETAHAARWTQAFSAGTTPRRPRVPDSEAVITRREVWWPGCEPKAQPAPKKPRRGPGCDCFALGREGAVHDDVCRRLRWAKAEGTPSAVASAPERRRDTFADLCSDWDLLPDAK